MCITAWLTCLGVSSPASTLSRTKPGLRESSSLWVSLLWFGVWSTINICVWKNLALKMLFLLLKQTSITDNYIFTSLDCRLCSKEVLRSSRHGSCPAPCLQPRPFVTTWGISGLAPLRLVPQRHLFFFSRFFIFIYMRLKDFWHMND